MNTDKELTRLEPRKMVHEFIQRSKGVVSFDGEFFGTTNVNDIQKMIEEYGQQEEAIGYERGRQSVLSQKLSNEEIYKLANYLYDHYALQEFGGRIVMTRDLFTLAIQDKRLLMLPAPPQQGKETEI